MGRFTNENIPVGRNNADNITDTTNIVANIDGSVLERLEALQGAGAGASPGIDYYVNSDTASDDNGDGLSWATAKQKIGAAVALMVDNDNCYVGGTSYSEAVTTPTGVDRCKLISVHNSKQSPLWQSGAAGSSHLTIIGGKWEVSGFRFHGGNSNTVAFLELDTLAPLVANGPYIHDCYFTVGGATGPALRFHGGCYDPIVDNCEFFGFTADNTDAQVGTLCGFGHANSTQNPIITNNTFTECVNAINMQCSDGLFKGNNFGRIGKTNDCTTTMHLIHSTLDDGTHDGDGANIITQNVFDWDSSELTQANGFWFSDTDMIVGNYCRDGVQSSNVTGIGKCWYVDSDGVSDTRTGHNWSTSFKTIQAAVTACSSYDTIYVRGYAAFGEAVTTTNTATNVKLIGCSDSQRRPQWFSGATGSSCLTINGRDWQVEGMNFQSAGNTVALIHVQEDGTNYKGIGVVIKNNNFHGVGSAHSAIRLSGGIVQAKILNNRFAEFYGKTHGNGGNNWEATIWGNDYSQSAVHVDIIGNHFIDCLDSIKLQAVGCVIKDNIIPKVGYLSNTTTVLNLVCGGGSVGGNTVVGNYFDITAATLTHVNGFHGSTDDMWIGNYCSDGFNSSDGTS